MVAGKKKTSRGGGCYIHYEGGHGDGDKMEIINFLEKHGVLVTTDFCGAIVSEFEVRCPKCNAYSYSDDIDGQGISKFLCPRCTHKFESAVVVTHYTQKP